MVSKNLTKLYPFNYKKFFVMTNDENYCSERIAAFDFDCTLIRSTKGVWIVDPDFFDIWHPIVYSKLSELHSKGYKIAIFTNRSDIERKLVQEEKIVQIYHRFFGMIGLPKIQIFVAAAMDHFRKPSPRMWEVMEAKFNNGVKIDKKNSFYVGDAGGRIKGWSGFGERDFSVADRKFASNLKVTYFTPEEFFLGYIPTLQFGWRSINPTDLLKFTKDKVQRFTPSIDFNTCKKNTRLFILCGWKCCGKTTFAKRYLPDFTLLSSADLGGHDNCVKKAKEIFLRDKSCKIVIDSENETFAKRSEFINIALSLKLDFKILFFRVNPLILKHLNLCREIFTEGLKKRQSEAQKALFRNRLEIPFGSNVVNVRFVFEPLDDNHKKILLQWT